MSTTPTQTTYGVAGMTCDQCVAAVRAQIGALHP
jgi:copper chaperone CopZ